MVEKLRREIAKLDRAIKKYDGCFDISSVVVKREEAETVECFDHVRNSKDRMVEMNNWDWKKWGSPNKEEGKKK